MSFKGIIPPIITPLHEDGSIDRDGFLAMMEHLIGAGVHGIIIGGTTGEYYSQTRDAHARPRRRSEARIGKHHTEA
jgi:4-hydroxy-tetrahydrodipicolinate synthase